MKTIFYTLADGRTIEIEVSDEFAEEYKILSKKEELVERKETRRHVEFFEEQYESNERLEEVFFKSEDKEKLNRLLLVLKRRDRELFKEHYIGGMSMTEIAKREGMSLSTISKKLKRIRKKIYELWLK